MSTIYLEFSEIAGKYGDRRAVSWKRNGDWNESTYTNFKNKIDNFANSLVSLGIGVDSKVAILSENCPEWLMSDLAINKIAAVSVPIHYTANAKLIEYNLKDSDSKNIIISQKQFEKHVELLRTFDFLENIIIINEPDKTEFGTCKAFSLLIEDNDSEIVEAKEHPEDLFTIIYTSGTTGDPKGVMLSNNNVISDVKNTLKALEIKPEDRFLSFLPLSHVLERSAGSILPMFVGSSISYAESVAKLSDNLKEVKPTILVSVPKIFEKIYEKIRSEIKNKPGIIKKFFYWSLNQSDDSFGKKMADKIIYSKIRESFGGEIRMAISGGASINVKIIKFFSKIYIKIVEGYGLTETSPMISVNPIDDYRAGSVGKIIPNVEVKISEDKEILVKGENVMKGYYKKPEKTKEEFTDDGWFKTGDLGFIDNDGYLTIIGRKKEMIVTTNGKNISPEKIEAILNLSPYILQSLIVGHKRPHLSALITLDQEYIDSASVKVDENLIQKEIDAVNKELMPHEYIKKFKILKSPFTIEDDELTPTLKIRRKFLEEKYRGEIEEVL